MVRLTADYLGPSLDMIAINHSGDCGSSALFVDADDFAKRMSKPGRYDLPYSDRCSREARI